MNAVAMLTEVSFTLHFSGLGGDVMTFGAPGLWSCTASRCFRRAKRNNAGSFSSSSSRVLDGDEGFGGDLEPSAGALRDCISDDNDSRMPKIQTRRRRRKEASCRWMLVCREKSYDRDVCLDLRVCPKMTCNRFETQSCRHAIVSRIAGVVVVVIRKQSLEVNEHSSKNVPKLDQSAFQCVAVFGFFLNTCIVPILGATRIVQRVFVDFSHIVRAMLVNR